MEKMHKEDVHKRDETKVKKKGRTRENREEEDNKERGRKKEQKLSLTRFQTPIYNAENSVREREEEKDGKREIVER